MAVEYHTFTQGSPWSESNPDDHPRLYPLFGEKVCCNRCNRILPGVDRVIYQGTKTIVKWTDGSTTIVDCVENDIFDKETGLAMAIARKYFHGSRAMFKDCVENAKTYDGPKKR